MFLPSVEFISSGPGFEHVYMRGVSSSVLENHSGSLPTVGVYLDEQPVTTIATSATPTRHPSSLASTLHIVETSSGHRWRGMADDG